MANKGAAKAAVKKEADKKASAKKAAAKKAADNKKAAADKKGGADKKKAAGEPAAASKPQPDDPSSPKSDSRQTYEARVKDRKATSSGYGSDEELLRAEVHPGTIISINHSCLLHLQANAVLQMNELYAPGEPTRSEDTAQKSSGEDEEVQDFNFDDRSLCI